MKIFKRTRKVLGLTSTKKVNGAKSKGSDQESTTQTDLEAVTAAETEDDRAKPLEVVAVSSNDQRDEEDQNPSNTASPRTRLDQIEEVCSIVISRAIQEERRKNKVKEEKSRRSRRSSLLPKVSLEKKEEQEDDDDSSSSKTPIPIQEVVSGYTEDGAVMQTSIVSEISSNSLSSASGMQDAERKKANGESDVLVQEIRLYVRKVLANMLETIDEDVYDNCSMAHSESSLNSTLKLNKGFSRTELSYHANGDEGFELAIKREFKHIPPKMKFFINRMVMSAILTRRENFLEATASKHKARALENKGPDPIEEAMREIEFLPEEPM